MLKVDVCTLFEGHYHYGVAGLINSLQKYGFKGAIYVGYRGELPGWAASASNSNSVEWAGAKSMLIANELHIHFLPVSTKWHLVNYKPDFILELIKGPSKKSDGIAYFDPDIVITKKWEYYDNWISHGVALVHESVSNDMPPSHPLRQTWKEMICSHHLGNVRELYSYINGGFCAIQIKHKEFIQKWSTIMQIGFQFYGMNPEGFMLYERPHPFHASDQDALNITAMCCESPISEVGPEGMGFIGGVVLMAHATGSPKPWKKQFLKSAFLGQPPSRADKAYWENVNGAIKITGRYLTLYKKISVKTAGFIGRFYKKG